MATTVVKVIVLVEVNGEEICRTVPAELIGFDGEVDEGLARKLCLAAAGDLFEWQRVLREQAMMEGVEVEDVRITE